MRSPPGDQAGWTASPARAQQRAGLAAAPAPDHPVAHEQQRRPGSSSPRTRAPPSGPASAVGPDTSPRPRRRPAGPPAAAPPLAAKTSPNRPRACPPPPPPIRPWARPARTRRRSYHKAVARGRFPQVRPARLLRPSIERTRNDSTSATVLICGSAPRRRSTSGHFGRAPAVILALVEDNVPEAAPTQVRGRGVAGEAERKAGKISYARGRCAAWI